MHCQELSAALPEEIPAALFTALFHPAANACSACSLSLK
jgi:hypothetical protein